MITIDDLQEIYSLFIDGMLIGGILSAIPFILGYTINFIYSLIKSA